MSGLENLSPAVLRMVLVWLDANSLLQLSRVSSTLHEQAMEPEVWKERLEEVAGEGQWGRDPSGYLELLRQHRFSKVEYFVFAGTEAVTSVLWDQLVVEMEGRGSRGRIGFQIHGDLRFLSSTSLARLVESAHCVDIRSCGALMNPTKELLLMALGNPGSKVRHARVKGIRFENDAAVSHHLVNIVGKTWTFHTDRSSFSEVQLNGIDWSLAGSRRSEVVPAGGCGLLNCPVAVDEEKQRLRRQSVEEDLHFFFYQAGLIS